MCISGAPLSAHLAHRSLLKYLPGYWRYDSEMPVLLDTPGLL